MPQHFNRREINIITDDLKNFLSALKGPIDKLDYFTTRSTVLESTGSIELDYQFEHVDIIPEVENAVIQQMELAEKKEAGIQLHLSPAFLLIHTDRLFFQQIFFRLLSTLLEANEKRSAVSVYVMDSDGKCIIEVINQSATATVKAPDEYFKKYRITNIQQSPSVQLDALLAVYKKLIEGMGGELWYAFEKGKANYFRLKFDTV